MAERKPSINTDDVVGFLNRAFAKATFKAAGEIGNKAVRVMNRNGEWVTTDLYDAQVDFCYLIDNIQRSPAYIVPKYIQQANELIERIEKFKA